MEIILKTAFIYLFLLGLFRITGKRTLAQVTTFDLVLLLLISEAVQQAMVGENNTLFGGILAASTLVGIEFILTLVKLKNKGIDKLIEGEPVIIVENGKVLRHKTDSERIDDDEILEAARLNQGLERMSQIKYAILEKNGGISIIPKEKSGVGEEPAVKEKSTPNSTEPKRSEKEKGHDNSGTSED